MVKAILMRSQMEMRNTLSDNRGNAILVINCRRPWLFSCLGVLWKLKLVRNEISYLTDEISNQNVEGVAWFLLTTYIKMQVE